MFALLQKFVQIRDLARAGDYLGAARLAVSVLNDILSKESAMRAGPDDAAHLTEIEACCQEVEACCQAAPKTGGGAVALLVLQIVLPAVIDWIKTRRSDQ